MLLKKLTALANKLDQNGFYKEASMVDKFAEEFGESPKEWEMEMAGMDISPEMEEKQREYEERMVPTDPTEVDELGSTQRADKKIQEGYDAGTHLLLRMHDVLDKLEDYYEYEDHPHYEETSGMITTPASEMDADTPTVELPEKQPGDRKYFEQLMQRQKKRKMPPTYKPSQSRPLSMPQTYAPSKSKPLPMPKTYTPSGPARKQ